MFPKIKIWLVVVFGFFSIGINGARSEITGRNQCADYVQWCLQNVGSSWTTPCAAWKGITSTTSSHNPTNTNAQKECMDLRNLNSKDSEPWSWVCHTTCFELKPGISCDGPCIIP
jgi:hypothetical protein